MKTRASIAKDARWLRSGSNSSPKAEQGVEKMGKTNRQSAGTPAKRTRAAAETPPRIDGSPGRRLRPSADDPGRPGCSGVVAKRKTAGTDQVCVAEVQVAEVVAEETKNNASESQPLEAAEVSRDEVTIEKNPVADPVEEKAEKATGVIRDSRKESRLDEGRERRPPLTQSKTRLRISAKVFGAVQGVGAKRETPPRTTKRKDLGHVTVRDEAPAAAESGHATSGDGGVRGGAEVKVETQMSRAEPETAAVVVDEVEGSTTCLPQDVKEEPQDEHETRDDEANGVRLDVENPVEDGSDRSCQKGVLDKEDKTDESRQEEVVDKAEPRPPESLGEGDAEASQPIPTAIVENPWTAEGSETKDTNTASALAAKEAVSENAVNAVMEELPSETTEDKDAQHSLPKKEQPAEEPSAPIGAAEEQASATTEELEPIMSTETENAATEKSETPTRGETESRRRSKSEKRPSAKQEPSRALPKRRCSTLQTSLTDFVTKRPRRESTEAARDSSSSSSFPAEEDGSSSDDLVVVSQRPRKRRRKTQDDIHPAEEDVASKKMVQRRDVAVQVVADAVSSNVWFEFYAAEPAVRRKMYKRNHYTQTNARMIAELDYKKCTVEPVVKTKYFCGVEGCSYRSTVTNLIGHVKGQHLGYKTLVCKRCRKKHESLALFVCHLGSRSCPCNESEEEEERSASSGGEEPASEMADAEQMQVDEPVDSRSVSSAPSRSESLVPALPSSESFPCALLRPGDIPQSSRKKVSRSFEARTERTRALFISDPLLDLLRFQPLQLDRSASTPHALFRTLAPFLTAEESARLSFLLRFLHLHSRLTKSVTRRVLALRRKFEGRRVEATSKVREEPLSPPKMNVEVTYEGSQSTNKPPEDPSAGKGMLYDLLQQAVDALSSPPAGTPSLATEQPHPPRLDGIIVPSSQQDLCSTVTPTSQSGTLSYVIPMVLDGKNRSFTTYVMPTVDVNRMLMPLVTDPPKIAFDTSGKFPKLMPKASTPCLLRAFSQQQVPPRRRYSTAKKRGPPAPPVANKQPQPATTARMVLGTTPRVLTKPTTIVHTSNVWKTPQQANANVVAQVDVASAEKVAAATANLQALKNVVEKGLHNPATTSSTPGMGLQKYRDVFQAALERAVKASEASTVRSTPEVSERPTPGGVLVYLCECTFVCRTKMTLEEHIRKEHIGDGYLCRICSINFSQLGELERHFLRHVKVAKEEAATTSRRNEKQESVTTVLRRPQTALERPSSPDRSSPSHLKDLMEKINACCASSKSASMSKQDVLTVDVPVQRRQQVAVIDIDSSDTESSPSRSKVVVSQERASVPLREKRPDLVGSEAIKPFFKCVIGDCCVTSDDPKEFSIHLTSHSCKDLVDLHCIYCESTFDAIGAMVSHATEKHGLLVYQCGWCLYRAAVEPLLQLHLRSSHPDREALFYRCDPADFAVDDTPPEKPEHPEYRCGVPGCGFQSFGSSRLLRHYGTDHPKVTRYTCAFCDLAFESVDALVDHCVVHGLYPVHCAFCRHGTRSFAEILQHLCDAHADRSPDLFIRTPGGQQEFRAFVDRPENRAIFTPAEFLGRLAAEVQSDEMSKKPCPFCSASVRKLSDIVDHCSSEHKIALPISTVLDLLLKKAAGEKSRSTHLSCPLCDFEGGDCDRLKEHLHKEFGYAPQGSTRDADFERWVVNLVDERQKIPEKIRQAFLCVQCEQRFSWVSELRTHLYSHKKYFPHQCTVCAESFTTVEEAEQHQREQHKMSPPFLLQQVRLAAVEQVVEESLEAQVDAVRERIRGSSVEFCLWDGCKYHSSERSILLEHMNAVHIGTRHTCASCSFVSYSKDVVMWHAKTAHRAMDVPESAQVVVESPAPIAPKPRGTFKCSYCKFRGNSSVAIREHAATAHRGLPVKMVAPPRPASDFDGPVKTPVVAVKSGAPTPSVPSAEPSPIEIKRLRCSRCSFSAPSEKILGIHWSNLHRSDSENDDEETAALPSVDDVGVSSTTVDFFDDLSRPGPSRTAFEGTPPSTIYRPRIAGKDAVMFFGTGSPYGCAGCIMEFDSKPEYVRHLAKRHRICALCAHCERAFMNKKQVLDHCAKYHPTLEPKYEAVSADGPRTSEGETTKVDSEGFSWYNRKREPLDLDKIYMQAQVPCFGQGMKLTVATFFAVQRRRPVLRIKDFTKLL